MADPVALAALALDALIGWPGSLYRRVGHPVGGFARVIGACEQRWNTPDRTQRQRRTLGVAAMLLLLIGTALFALLLELLIRHALGASAWVAIALLAWPALAQRSLFDHVRPVAAALEDGNLPAARHAVAMIVGRDTDALDSAGIARAGIESLAESFCDGVVAPLFWLLVAGLPGLWCYKAINTADSLIGHKEPRWRAYGWAAARIDDAANWIPARLAGVLLCIAGAGGWRVMWLDCRRHASPNAGWPEAAMAGALGVALAGPIAYDGQMQMKPWIGDGAAAARAADLNRALAVYVRACALLWVLVGIVAWLR
ncbi:adenosylcobinamide-phosphate synthase CbiB [Sphingomonas sp. Mn802worker]|uniref:adenosylcobinamide-phosphate synthase CbiB n=1 Tax=Sphingomonas sp. Mn802worker TaxID=629773 RepID=UPI0003720DED|nr:adenosylcobinamide-phosphate synthase CbiB [Sphingomonas sp. Mn802worker]